MLADNLTPTEYRYERKFLVSDLDRYEMEAIIKLHPAIFSEIYHQRTVNNIYLDTPDLSSYQDNLGGIGQRMKVRIRWYGATFGVIEKPALELKIKKGFLGSKLRFSLPPFALDTGYSLEKQQGLFAEAGLPEALFEYLKSLRFAVLNRYRRKYFESADLKFRITLDFDMAFFRIDPQRNLFMESSGESGPVVLELKYGRESDDEARFITNHLPFRMTKNSKYVEGIERLSPFLL